MLLSSVRLTVGGMKLVTPWGVSGCNTHKERTLLDAVHPSLSRSKEEVCTVWTDFYSCLPLQMCQHNPTLLLS